MKLISTLVAPLLGSLAWVAAASAQKPNFIVIVADDLGYGDLGCYGSTRNRTPNIDQLAAEGARFTDYHRNGPMCTPTRAALMTGRYQHRFGKEFESALAGQAGAGVGLPLQAVTLAERLKESGYATGMFGKWHLGYEPPFLPTRQGFDEFRGLLCGDGDHHTHRDRAGGRDWWHNEMPAVESGYTAELLTKHSVSFIERNRDRPFFLYLPHLAIHFPWQGPDDPPHRVEEKDYKGDKFGFISDRANVAPHVKAMVEALDASVGVVMAALRRLKLEENTLVIFTSDNGGYINYGDSHQNISNNGPLRGQKGELFEGGHRVAGIVRWPGRIEPRVETAFAMTFDFFPTILQLAGIGAVETDAVDLGSLLFQRKALPERNAFWRMHGRWAVRQGSWKLIENGNGPMLFNLGKDLGEAHDAAAANPEQVIRMRQLYEAWDKEVARGVPGVPMLHDAKQQKEKKD